MAWLRLTAKEDGDPPIFVNSDNVVMIRQLDGYSVITTVAAAENWPFLIHVKERAEDIAASLGAGAASFGRRH